MQHNLVLAKATSAKRKIGIKIKTMCIASHAHFLSFSRKNNRKAYKFTENIAKESKNLLSGTPLEKFYSPEQIVGAMKKENKTMVSHETLYQWIYADKKAVSNLYQNLRQKHKKRRKRLNEKDRRGVIPNKLIIDQRLDVINNKERYGDWEGDTIIGANHQCAILTLVERKSKYTYICKLDAKTVENTENIIVNFFEKTGLPCFSITFDNGKEFTNHQQIATRLKTQIFFANPYHSWERGCNENTNGLIRQYIPKKSNFDDYTVERIAEINQEFNNRPRKTLNFDTPIQILNKGVV